MLGASHTPAGKGNESPTRYTRFQRPPNTVNVQGNHGQSAADDDALGKDIGRHVQDAVDEAVAKQIRIQMRPGGLLKR